MEDRQRRADRWIEGSSVGIGTVEPEWWLRMMCGQLAREDSFHDWRGAVRIGWLGLLSRRIGRRTP
ncbi:MAG: hypothetical protein QOJ33_2536 [Chloroflexota bacterium]|nr:hypothetical protein [Chloroflexota bacterium]